MEYRQLGDSDMQVSVIGLGCWAMGGEFWGEQEDEESVATVRKALDLGINFLDTADAYGWGRSERAVGEGIKGRRHEAIVATKAARTIDAHGQWGVDCSRKHLLEAVEESLRHLQTDCIDLYQLHTWDEKTPLEETLGAMQELVTTGKVRYVGCSNYSVDQLRRAVGITRVVSMQPPYSLFNRGIEEHLLPFCSDNNLGVVVYGPLHTGMLSGKFAPATRFPEGDLRHDSSEFTGEGFARNLACVERLKVVAGRYGKTVAQLALAWTVQQSGVTVAIAGARRPSQVEDNAGGAGWRIREEDLKEIEQVMATR